MSGGCVIGDAERVRTGGAIEANTAPAPMNRLWVAKPRVRCSFGSMSPTSARNGSMVTLSEASRSQSVTAAAQSAGEFGMNRSAKVDSTAPVRK